MNLESLTCPHGHTGFYKLNKKGARVCDECQIIGRRRYRENNKERVIALQDYWTEFYLFGGNRELTIQRDGEKCVTCGMTRAEHKVKFNRDITVDHIDGKGRNTPLAERNNDMSNLQTLCLPCHGHKDGIRGYEEMRHRE